MKYNWLKEPEFSQNKLLTLMEELNISEKFAQILLARNIDSAANFHNLIELKDFEPFDPFLIANMKEACDLIDQCIEEDKVILIYGDYDADGLTSTSILYETLLIMGANVKYYIPNRFEDGYGPNLETYKKILDSNIALLLTIDNGVSGTDAFKYAKELGIKIIVCDHHQIPSDLSSDIDLLIHPANPKGNYPNHELTGVGVAYKLACALMDDEEESLLDLVAIGTLGDVAAMTPENKWLIKKGLSVIKQSERIGLSEILKKAKIDLNSLTEETINFQITPRINSAGRLDKSDFVVDLLTTFDSEVAEKAAKKLELLNQKRKELSNTMSKEALLQVDNSPNDVLVAVSKNWTEGIIGIIAARIVDKMQKPALVLYIDEKNGIAKGSARSVGDVNIYDIINSQSDLLLNFGGHRGAAGFTIDLNNLKTFTNKISKISLAKDKLRNDLKISCSVELADLTENLFNELVTLRPFGRENSEPIFSLSNFSTDQVHRIGENGEHLRLSLKDNKQQINAIGFKMGFLEKDFLSNNISKVACHLTQNRWNNLVQLQLSIIDVEESKPLIYDYRLKKIQKNFFEKVSWPLVFFNSSKIRIFQDKYPKLSDHLYLAKDALHNLKEIVLVDQPANIDQFENFLKNNLQIQKIVILFLDPLNLALDGFPDRTDFIKCYRILNKYKLLNYEAKNSVFGLNPAKIKVILNVFFDLKFVTIKNDKIIFNSNTEFHDLTDSEVYRNYQDKYKFQQTFLLSTTDELKKKIKRYL